MCVYRERKREREGLGEREKLYLWDSYPLFVMLGSGSLYPDERSSELQRHKEQFQRVPLLGL